MIKNLNPLDIISTLVHCRLLHSNGSRITLHLLEEIPQRFDQVAVCLKISEIRWQYLAIFCNIWQYLAMFGNYSKSIDNI